MSTYTASELCIQEQSTKAMVVRRQIRKESTRMEIPDSESEFCLAFQSPKPGQELNEIMNGIVWYWTLVTLKQNLDCQFDVDISRNRIYNADNEIQPLLQTIRISTEEAIAKDFFAHYIAKSSGKMSEYLAFLMDWQPSCKQDEVH